MAGTPTTGINSFPMPNWAGLVDPFRPAAALAETFSRATQTANTGALISARMHVSAIYLPAGLPITSITYAAAGTPAATPTHQWFALADNNATPAKLAVTADDIDTAWAANANKTLAVSRTVTDAAITSGAATLTSATAAFTAADTGKQVTVLGAGAAGIPLGTSASPVTMTYVNATTVTLSANAASTVSGAVAYLGTPFLTTYSGLHYVGITVVAGTVPSLLAINQSNSTSTGPYAMAPKLAGASNTGQTTPQALPNPITAPNQAYGIHPYAYVS